jgi:molybdopterin-containing oxidoreductase family iron-sulfur binding subunit
MGRDMGWIRLERYYEAVDASHAGPLDVRFLPMICQHCGNAPCEPVCPVFATYHTPDGINTQVYNRCVGTRYCANNCPYKVRRFNFLRYQEKRLKEPVQELMFNPQVTVRGIGVMEKCSFCVQRINAAKFEAQNAEKPLEDGAVQTACQQACPAEAIVFGDANDPQSALAGQREAGRAFHVLEELNVKPNVTYLARVRNPNQNVTSDNTSHDGGHAG